MFCNSENERVDFDDGLLMKSSIVSKDYTSYVGKKLSQQKSDRAPLKHTYFCSHQKINLKTSQLRMK